MAERVGKRKQRQTLFLFTVSNKKKMYLHRCPSPQLLFSHCGLNHFLFIVGKHVSGLCECGSSETVKHVFLECRKYSTERHALFGRLSVLGLGGQAFSVCSLFGHCDNHKLISGAVLQFLHRTGLYGTIQLVIGPVEGSNTLDSVQTAGNRRRRRRTWAHAYAATGTKSLADNVLMF